MKYRVFIDLEVEHTLSRQLQEVLKTAISAIITDNAEDADVNDIRFAAYAPCNVVESVKTVQSPA